MRIKKPIMWFRYSGNVVVLLSDKKSNWTVEAQLF